MSDPIIPPYDGELQGKPTVLIDIDDYDKLVADNERLGEIVELQRQALVQYLRPTTSTFTLTEVTCPHCGKTHVVEKGVPS